MIIEKLPRTANMFFGRADVANGEAQRELIAQARVRDEDRAGGVGVAHELLVEGVEPGGALGFSLVFFRGAGAEADDAQRDGREQFPLGRVGDP